VSVDPWHPSWRPGVVESRSAHSRADRTALLSRLEGLGTTFPDHFQHALHHTWNVELGGVDHHRVIGRSQRCRLPVGIALVTSRYLPKKGGKASIVFLAIQLLMAPERPGFSARRQENL